MGEMKTSWIEVILMVGGIIALVLGFVKEIEESLRITLLIASPSILAIACLFKFLNNQDQISEKLAELEEKLIRAESLIDIRTNLTGLNKRLEQIEQKRIFR